MGCEVVCIRCVLARNPSSRRTGRGPVRASRADGRAAKVLLQVLSAAHVGEGAYPVMMIIKEY